MLSDIMLEFAANDGVSLSDQAQKDYLKFRINAGAQELYQENDLVGSLMEQVFDVQVDSGMLVSFPSYVGKIRAIRPHKLPNQEGIIRDIRARYVNAVWPAAGCYDYREVSASPLAIDIQNAAPLTVKFLKPVAENVSVTISGATEYSQFASETLDFSTGDTEKTGELSFTLVKQINKSAITEYNAEVLDIEGNVLSVIPNDKFSVEYIIVQLLELMDQQSVELTDAIRYVDVLYKLPFRPFSKDTDEFVCGPKYDKAIYWKTKAQIAASRKGEEQNAIGYAMACANIVKQLYGDQDRGKKIEMTGKNFVYSMFDSFGRICR